MMWKSTVSDSNLK